MTNRTLAGLMAGTRSGPVDRVVPGPGQESVWDYPRPPRVEPVAERLRVVVDGVTVAEHDRAASGSSRRPARRSTTSRPRTSGSTCLRPSPRRSVCEWKGDGPLPLAPPRATARSTNVAWSYPDPLPGFEAIRDHLAFYAGRVDEAWVGDERATPQPGHFYGGWVTSRIVGPIKGEPGSFGW